MAAVELSEVPEDAAGVGKRRATAALFWLEADLIEQRTELSSDLLLARLDESESNRIHEQFAYDLNSRALPPPRFRLELSISSTQSAPLGVAREEMIRAVYLLGIAAEACAGLRSVRTAGYDGERGCWVDDSDYADDSGLPSGCSRDHWRSFAIGVEWDGPESIYYGESEIRSSFDGVLEYPTRKFLSAGVSLGGDRDANIAIGRLWYVDAEGIRLWSRLLADAASLRANDDSFWIAARFYYEALCSTQQDVHRTLLLASVSLEALLADNERQEISHQVAVRGALLMNTPGEAREYYSLIKKVYSERSFLVHGGRSPNGRVVAWLLVFLRCALSRILAIRSGQNFGHREAISLIRAAELGQSDVLVDALRDTHDSWEPIPRPSTSWSPRSPNSRSEEIWIRHRDNRENLNFRIDR